MINSEKKAVPCAVVTCGKMERGEMILTGYDGRLGLDLLQPEMNQGKREEEKEELDPKSPIVQELHEFKREEMSFIWFFFL